MSDVAKTFFTAVAAVASAAVIAVCLADRTDTRYHLLAPAQASQSFEASQPLPPFSSTPPTQWAKQTMPGPQADQASKPRG